MKTLLLIAILFLCSCKSSKIQDPRYKTFRPAKVQKVKLKKSKLAKQYRFNELTKREKKLKARKTNTGDCPTYTIKNPKHYQKVSKKINPKYFCNPTKD